MSTLVPIPKLGQSEETVKIEKWRVKEGDKIKKGDILFEVETDKAVLEVESQFEGTLLKIIIPAGREVPVMATAAVIGNPGEAIPKIEAPKAIEKKAEVKKPAEVKAAAVPAVAKSAQAQTVSAPTATAQQVSYAPAAPEFKPKPSPRARKFAEDYLISLDAVPGSGGENGRVTEADVKNYGRFIRRYVS